MKGVPVGDPRRCACGCGRPRLRPDRPYASRSCYLAHRTATGGYRRLGRAGGTAAALTKKRRAFQKVVRAVGMPITKAQAAIYVRGYRNGYEAGRIAARRGAA